MRWISGFFWWAIKKVWEYMFHALRIVLPLLPRIAWFAILTMAFALSVIIVGFRKTLDTMAFEWSGRAIKDGWPRSTETFLYWFFYVLAALTILVGWVMIAFTVVYIVQLAFGR